MNQNLVYNSKKSNLFRLCWVFTAAGRLALVVASKATLELRWLPLLQSTSSRVQASAVVAHGLSCSAACDIFPDQVLNLCPLHWQTDS